MRLILTSLAVGLALSGLSSGEHWVEIGVEDDAEGVVAVSAFGNATACREPWCVAVSGTGNATAPSGGCFSCIGGTAVSIGGDARGNVAAAPTGHASCSGGCVLLIGNSTDDGGQSVAIFGNATNARGIGVSAFGNASACTYPEARSGWQCTAIAPFGRASGNVQAISVFGDADAREAVSVFGDARGETVVTVTGDANHTCDHILCLAAVTVTGHASGPGRTFSGCDTLAAAGRDEGCIDPI